MVASSIVDIEYQVPGWWAYGRPLTCKMGSWNLPTSWLGGSSSIFTVVRIIRAPEINCNHTNLRDNHANSPIFCRFIDEKGGVCLDATSSLHPVAHHVSPRPGSTSSSLLSSSLLFSPLLLSMCHKSRALEQHDVLSLTATVNVFARGSNRPDHWRHPRDRTSHGASSS